MPRKGYYWVKTNTRTPIKLSAWEKDNLMVSVKAVIDKTSRLKKYVHRIEVQRGRVYLYYLYETDVPEGAVLLKPLIDGKYLEYPLARFTIYDKGLKICTFDWQDSTDKWMVLGEGTLEECIQQAETSEWLTI